MSDSYSPALARNQNQLSEQLQVLELLRKRRGVNSSHSHSDRSLECLAEQGSRRGRLAVQDNETLMLQLIALSLLGQTRGDTVAVALDKRNPSNFTFVLATNRRHTPLDEDRARRFFEVAASADSERVLLQFTLESSSRKVNRRLAKLKKSIAQFLPAIKRLIQGYRWPGNDLRRRARGLLPMMRAKFGEIPLPKLYVKILNALTIAVTPNRPLLDSPSNDDYDRFLNILNMSAFILSTHFISSMAQNSRYSEPMAILERRLYRVAQYLMGATSLIEMRRTFPRKGFTFPYVWAAVGGEPHSVEDIFLLRTPLEVAREVDARWTESELRTKLTNLGQWVPFSSPRIHAELRLIVSCNRAFLDPSFDAYDPRKPAAVRIASSHDVCTLCALWVTVYNRHFGTRYKVFPMGGSGKMDQNWAFPLSLRERPDRDVCEFVCSLLENELSLLQDTSRAPWKVLLHSIGPWVCLPVQDESMVSQRGSTTNSTQTYVRLLASPSGVIAAHAFGL
ncbi:hypothetical protein B0F90DRAFT_649157 [Multifurca ochricompacta]|uniref:Uncharacterized protein n=1 Tax=Multifurca ochricompacta TaxID=376703 RepID=A0AAD4M2H3_9AGAM|nr:hypothetical protein B0F90DRAFT_649157 [Multifurca ochricompacta]